jgi:glucose/arabinose dehydrogenase
MLVVFGILLAIIAPIASAPALPVAARTNSTSNAPPANPPVKAAIEAAPEPKATPEPTAPEVLKLQGLAYSLPNPWALINGRTYFVGDSVGRARVVSIDAQRVVIEQEGTVKVLELGR